MRELSVPAIVTVPDDANLSDAVYSHAVDHPDAVVYSVRSGDDWSPVTTRQFAAEVSRLAKGLIAAGVNPGDRVGLMAKTRYEWTLVNYAIWAAGAVLVPIYETSSAEQVQWILGDSGAVGVVVETPAHAETVESVRADLSGVKNVWQIDAGDLDALRASGDSVDDSVLAERRSSRNREDTATIIYTSGTTGRPKGCELTHGNVLFDAQNAIAVLGGVIGSGQSTLLFLPLAHSFAQVIQIATFLARVRLGHHADLKSVPAALKSFQPTFVLAAPRVFEKVYNTAKQTAADGGKGKIFGVAEATAVEYSEAIDKGGPGALLKLKHAVFDKLVYGKLRAALGGKCASAISGSAPLGTRLGHFFRGIGLTVYEGYGLTETSPATSVNVPDATRIGTVGRPIPGVTVRIADDGEILIKGNHIFRGYWHNDEATAEALADGWFHSGDLGELDSDGYLSITGRKKEIIVTAGGKNVAPAVLEDRLRANALVSQCIVVGDAKPFIGCLVTIDPDVFPGWKERNGKPADATVADLRDDPDLMKEIQDAVDDANKAVSKAESIRKFRILDRDFTEEGGELTPTLKLKRAVILKEHSADLTALYG